MKTFEVDPDVSETEVPSVSAPPQVSSVVSLWLDACPVFVASAVFLLQILWCDSEIVCGLTVKLC